MRAIAGEVVLKPFGKVVVDGVGVIVVRAVAGSRQEHQATGEPECLAGCTSVNPDTLV